MKNYTTRNITLVTIIILVVSLGMYFILFVPEHNRLKDLTLQNFYHISEAKHVSLNHEIENNIESTESMSSRSFIRNKIVEYDQGIITFQELYDASYTKYQDGYVVLESALEALRIVDGEILLDMGETIIDTQKALSDVEGLRELSYEIAYQNELYMIVYSPIFVDTSVYGYDIIVYDLEQAFNAIQYDDYLITLVETNNTLMSEETQYENVYKEFDHYIYLHEISENHSISIAISEDHLYGELDAILFRNLVYTVLIVGVIMVFGNYLLISNAKQLMSELTSQHDMYKDKALTDNLTKTYSRQFLDQIMYDGTLKVSDTVVIMLDIDSFKCINDKYGHLVGDEVLRFVGIKLRDLFNNDDYVVRYGGDEFLIFVKSKNIDAVENILKNFNEMLNQVSEYEFDLSISYGISFVDSLGNLDEGIRKADNALYANKEGVKNK